LPPERLPHITGVEIAMRTLAQFVIAAALIFAVALPRTQFTHHV
jgi:hypothetical protein